MKKKRYTLLLMTLLAFVLIVSALLSYLTLTDYKPAMKEQLLVRHPLHKTVEVIKPLTITTLNLGYAGLDASQDFFMDGGKQSRAASEAQVSANLDALITELQNTQSDLLLLQEVDVDSTRSYYSNQLKAIEEQFPQYSSVFAYNYKAQWVPVPIFEPMGKAHSGLLSLSKFELTDQMRYDLPGKEQWPRQLFELDRAFIEKRLPVDNGKELIVLNVHLSAFDKGGSIRKQQLDYLKQYIQEQYAEEHYIIVGGDWNHALPGTDPLSYETTQQWPEWLQSLPEDFTPESFNWAINGKIPTVRTLDVPFQRGENFMAIIDGFLVSPNIEVVNVHTNDTNFAHSDHHAVTATLKLLP